MRNTATLCGVLYSTARYWLPGLVGGVVNLRLEPCSCKQAAHTAEWIASVLHVFCMTCLRYYSSLEAEGGTQPISINIPVHCGLLLRTRHKGWVLPVRGRQLYAVIALLGTTPTTGPAGCPSGLSVEVDIPLYVSKSRPSACACSQPHTKTKVCTRTKKSREERDVCF